MPRRTNESIPPGEAVHVASEYIASIIGRQPTHITAVTPSKEQGWVVEVEVVEDARIPRSADMLALYEIELDADGELLAYHRTHRYMRGNTLSPRHDEQWSVNGGENGTT